MAHGPQRLFMAPLPIRPRPRPYGSHALAWNPHIKFNNDLRGYLRVDLSAHMLEARFRVVDYVSELGSSVRTRAVFGVGDGEHRLHRIA